MNLTASSKQPLNKTTAKKAIASEKDYFLWHEKVKGLGLKIQPNGRKSYVCQYRIDGKSRHIKIADYHSCTLDQAISAAKEILVGTQSGEDALKNRKKARSAPTLTSE